jgi:hypothetical protein
MNTYILLLTLIFKSGYGGMGGIESIQTGSLDECNRIGNAWIASLAAKRSLNKGEAIFTCIRKEI